MPNLEYDPQNPSDLLGQPIAVGDIVAWGTVFGKSPALCIARIEKIRFVRDVPSGPYGSKKRKECLQFEATNYTLTLRPLKTTGSVTWRSKETGKEWYPHRDGPIDLMSVEADLKTIHHVKNIVRLSPDVIVYSYG